MVGYTNSNINFALYVKADRICLFFVYCIRRNVGTINLYRRFLISL